MKKIINSLMLCAVLVAFGLANMGCSQVANEEQLGGQFHERHESGIESQVNDN